MKPCYIFLAATLVLASGCTYWSSNRSNIGTYAGTSSFQESKPFPIDIVQLGVDLPADDVRSTLEQNASRIEMTSSRNKALLCADLGLGALYKGDLPVSRKVLDQAVLIMTSVTEAQELERGATSLTGSESEKYFKGEPHERSPVLFFRGLLYLVDEDIENAHACFLQAALQDATAEDPTHRGDWLCADLMALYCKQRMGTNDSAEWCSFIKRKYGVESLPKGYKNIGTKGLLVVCGGLPPQKIASKEKGQTLRYEDRPSRISSVRLTSGRYGSEVYLKTDNTYVQAVTRGSRGMDSVLQGKANVKTGVEVAGGTAAAVGAAVSAVPGAMLAGGLLKELSWSISDSVDSTADIRQVHMIPGQVFIIPLDKGSVSTDRQLEMLSESGRVLARESFTKPANLGDFFLAVARF